MLIIDIHAVLIWEKHYFCRDPYVFEVHFLKKNNSTCRQKESTMDEFVKQALEIVKAQAGVRSMTEDEMTSMVVKIANSIKNVSEQAPGMEIEASEPQFGDPKKAIKEKSVTCLECGKSFKVMTKKHLATHGLTTDEYREKYGYKKNTSLIAKSLSKARRKKMQEMQLWKKRAVKIG
jgi:predicted transcriptional regulator